MKKKASIILSSIFGFLFLLLLILVKFIDVQESSIGKNIGLYTLNNLLLPKKPIAILGTISTLCMLIGFLSLAFTLSLFIYRLCTEHNYKKIFSDYYPYILSTLLIVIFYLFFEVAIVNYRPILVDGQYEASFPSSHIFITITLLFTSDAIINDYFKNKTLKIITLSLSSIISLITFFGRILSMNHWFTDCLAGVILSIVLISLFYLFQNIFKNKEIK